MAQYLAQKGYDDDPGRVDDVQNGLLMTSTLHNFWDSSVMSINTVNLVNRIY